MKLLFCLRLGCLFTYIVSMYLASGGLDGCELASQPRGRGFNSYLASLSKVLLLAREISIYGLYAGKTSGCNSPTVD